MPDFNGNVDPASLRRLIARRKLADLKFERDKGYKYIFRKNVLIPFSVAIPLSVAFAVQSYDFGSLW